MSEPYCAQQECDARTGCIFGEANPNDCKYRSTNMSIDAASVISEFPMPWHGSVLGLTELQFVAARGRPRLVGVIGAHNAGKTTFLTSVYLMLCMGIRVHGRGFAGSFTLRGWEELAHHMRYPTPTQPTFPRHTPVTDDRVPGLLHLAFRNQEGRLEDYLFTDAPGEWFSNWARDRNADSAAGARWISANADEFLFFIDSEELAGANRGAARNLITALAQRLSDERLNRNVIVLWSKADHEINAEIKKQLQGRLSRCFPHAEHISITTSDQQRIGIQQVANSLITDHINCTGTAIECKCDSIDSFLQFRAE